MIHRIQKDEAHLYVMINKEMFHDQELSMRATGLLCYMLSLPDDWQFYETELVKHFPDGIKAVRSTIKELIDLGYIIKGTQKRAIGGQFASYDYDIYENTNRMPQRVCRQGVDRQGNTTNNNSTNNHLTNNNILHQTEFDDLLNDYSLKRFNRPLRKSNKLIDTNVIQDMDSEMFIEFLDDNIQNYDQCNYDYIEKIQDRAR